MSGGVGGAGNQPGPDPIRSLSHFRLPAIKRVGAQTEIDIKQQGADPNRSCPLAVQSPATALGSLSSVALSSERVDNTYHKTDEQINNNRENEQTKNRILTL